MRPQPALNWLVPLIVLLAMFAAGVGLFWLDGGQPFSFTTLHGQTVQMYGNGLYRNDTLQGGATFRGTDAVTLFVCLPLLVFAFLRYRGGSLRGTILLVSVLGYFLYNAASLAFSVAYNNLFIVYVALFSASLFAFVLAFAAIDLAALPEHTAERLPRGRIAAFLFVAGAAVTLIWLSDMIGSLVAGQAPEVLGSYTTVFTYALDVAVIGPGAILSGALLRRRRPLGIPLAAILLILNALIGLVVVGQTVVMWIDGVTLSPAEFAAFVGSFVVMALFAIACTVALFRGLFETPVRRKLATAGAGS